MALEYKIKQQDIDTIAEFARKRFANSSARFSGGNFLAECYYYAIMDFTENKHLVIDEGKIYKKE